MNNLSYDKDFISDYKFQYSQKAYERSLTRAPLKIEDEFEKMAIKTMNVPKYEMEGTWSFHGYFPKDCKPMPSCHMNKIEFKMDKGFAYTDGSDFHKDHGHGDQFKFFTYGNKTGYECSIRDRQQSIFGNTWVQGNKMMFSSNDDFALKWRKHLETPFIYDKHSTMDRLFIRDQKVDECWIVYDKMNQNSDEQFNQGMQLAEDTKVSDTPQKVTPSETPQKAPETSPSDDTKQAQDTDAPKKEEEAPQGKKIIVPLKKAPPPVVPKKKEKIIKAEDVKKAPPPVVPKKKEKIILLDEEFDVGQFDTVKKVIRKVHRKREMRVDKICRHIGGRWRKFHSNRKEPKCRWCPDYEKNKGLKPGDIIQLKSQIK